MKLLIVDDEPLIIYSIKNILKNSEYRGFQFLEAQNAEDAYEWIAAEHPEIILSDIQMPGADGIQLLKRINEMEYAPSVIFITGFSDFSYMQSAVRYQAFDYLLKPISAEVLLPCIKKAIQAVQKKEHDRKLTQVLGDFYKKNRQTLRKQMLENLLISPASSKKTASSDQLMLFGFDFKQFCLIGIRCNTNVTGGLMNQDYYIAYTLSQLITQKYPDAVSCYIGKIIYVLYPVTDKASGAEELPEFGEWISGYARENLFSSISVYISTTESDLAAISRLRTQLQECFSLKSSVPEEESEVIFYEDINENPSDFSSINEYISRLIRAIQARNSSLSGECAREFTEQLRELPVQEQTDSLKLLELNLHCQLRNMLSNPKDISYLTNPISRFCLKNPCGEEETEIFYNCIGNIVQELSFLSQKNSSHLMDCILDYIDQNYVRQIGLNDLAEYLNRNPSYLSRMIKKEQKKGFAQLLTERRLAEAKELLAKTTMKVADIAESVGYTSSKYFHQVFLNYVGMPPSDYRMLMQQF